MAIETEEQFRAWLAEQSQENCVWIAFRAAMRVVPFVTRVEERDEEADQTALMVLRALLISGQMGNGPTPDIEAAARFAARSAHSAAESIARSVRAAAHAADAAGHSASAAAYNFDSKISVPRTIAAAEYAVSYFARSFRSKIMEVRSVRRAVSFAAYRDADLGADLLPWTANPLPEVLQSAIDDWSAGRTDLLTLGGPWRFWGDWYARAMAGDHLPWDLQERIALIPGEVWEAGPEAVAAEIEKIEAAFEARSLPRPDTVPEIEKATLRKLVNGLLSVPHLTGDFALSAAETVERATQEYLNTSGENCLPPGLAPVSADTQAVAV